MTGFDAEWVRAEEAKRDWMAENSLYRAEDEHASCGVGLVVSIDGKASRKVVENGIDALKAVWHRGAVDADGKTGDGAGIHVQIQVPFFYDQIRRTGGSPAAWLLHLRLAPRSGEYGSAGREGQRDPARDRTDPHQELQGRG